ncbi:Hydrogenase expression/formation protein HupM (fragment) [Candidatus Terasakiella magnetica]
MNGAPLILGVGNLLWSDEGVGPRLIDLLRSRGRTGGAELVDGGTQGLYLLPTLTEADDVVLLDAVDVGRTPGEIVVLDQDQISALGQGRPLSLHQTSLHDLLAAAALIGWHPRRLRLVGIQAAETEAWGQPLTPVVEAALAQAAEIVETML